MSWVLCSLNNPTSWCIFFSLKKQQVRSNFQNCISIINTLISVSSYVKSGLFFKQLPFEEENQEFETEQVGFYLAFELKNAGYSAPSPGNVYKISFPHFLEELDTLPITGEAKIFCLAFMRTFHYHIQFPSRRQTLTCWSESNQDHQAFFLALRREEGEILLLSTTT